MNQIEKIQISSDKEINSCTKKTPLVKLKDYGNPPILNYNLPQSTCFDANGIIPLDIDQAYFKKELSENVNQYDYSKFFQSYYTDITHGGDEIPSVDILWSYVKTGQIFSQVLHDYPNSQLWLNLINNLSVENEAVARTNWLIFHHIALAYKDPNSPVPMFELNFSGDLIVKGIQINEQSQPQLFLIEHYKICTYIGDYGAGKVLKTFSLLPGEKTTISIRTYKQKIETKTKSENILDSFSNSSASDLESVLEVENNENSSSSFSSKQTKNSSKTVEKKLSASLSATPTKSASIGGGVGSSKTNSNGRETTLNNAREKNTNILNKSISKQTSKSDAFREVEINIETTISTTSEVETTIFREIENLNKSRVLNFTFRQLLQGYKTFTYLDNVSIAFTYGNPDSVLIEDLGTGKGLIEEVLEGTNTEGHKVSDIVYSQLLKNYCNILDYKKEKQQFFEKVTEKLDDCFAEEDIEAAEIEKFIYYRKRRNDLKKMNHEDSEISHKLDGIVLSVEDRIFRTDSVIVDALLGHGEALDCFNLELQEATVTKAHLDNIGIAQQQGKITSAIEILNKISDPELKAKLYETLFKECCNDKIIIKDIQ